MKGTQERGFILGTVEDIVLSLDDNAMNLQSMSASRFVGPFFEKVQKWEKSLSHISEVVDVRRDGGEGEREEERGEGGREGEKERGENRIRISGKFGGDLKLAVAGKIANINVYFN